jgi:hypothetical protein
MRDIGFSFDDDGPSFGKLDAHSTAFRRCADQINEEKLFRWSCHSTRAFSMTIRGAFDPEKGGK